MVPVCMSSSQSGTVQGRSSGGKDVGPAPSAIAGAAWPRLEDRTGKVDGQERGDQGEVVSNECQAEPAVCSICKAKGASARLTPPATNTAG